MTLQCNELPKGAFYYVLHVSERHLFDVPDNISIYCFLELSLLILSIGVRKMC
jgi:hypothetical protein